MVLFYLSIRYYAVLKEISIHHFFISNNFSLSLWEYKWKRLQIKGLIGNRWKAPDKKPPRIIAKYAVDANLFQLGSPNPKKKSSPWFFFLGFYTGGLLPGGFCPRGFCRVAFDLEPGLSVRTKKKSI